MTPEELYSQNEPLVRWTMKKYYCDFIDDEDLMQEGRIGLWRACLVYDEKKGFKFSSVAVSYIRNGMFENFDIWYDRLGSDDDCPFTVACRDRDVKNSERWVLVSFTVEEAKKICEYIQEQIHLHEEES